MRHLGLVTLVSFLGSFVVLATNAYALPVVPERTFDALDFIEPSYSPLKSQKYDSSLSVDFTAIVALSNCSGALVRLSSSLETDRGWILTNGHCLGGGFLKAGEVRVDVPVKRNFALLSKDGRSTLGTLIADRLVYATMTGTDMALYQITETYRQIESKYGIQALVLSAQHPQAGRGIAVASGYWKRIYTCSIDSFIYQLLEGEWTCNDSIRYSKPGCNTIGGTSGSPIIDTQTGEVVGVNNTGNEDGERCTNNNPCEVDEAGNVVINHKASYGQQTYWIYSCLDNQNHINLQRVGCVLPKPQQ